VTNSAGIVHYLWKNGTGGTVGTTANVNGLAAGTYTLTVTDTCTFVTCIATVSQPAAITGTTTSTDATCPTCPNGTLSILTVTGGTGTLHYTNLTGLLPGSYCITVTDDNGCKV